MQLKDIKGLWATVRCYYKKYSDMISFVFYTALVAVVIFGLNRGVYDGFAKPVPFIIILIFITMAFIRLYSWFVKKTKDEKSAESDKEVDNSDREEKE